MIKRCLFISFACILFVPVHLMAQYLKLSKLFADHMVFQRNQPVLVWGKAIQGEKVKVLFDGKNYSTITDVDGNWSISLPAFKASKEGRDLAVLSGYELITIKDILIGDVWLCSGQSNMEWTINNTLNGKEAIANANDPYIRQCFLPKHFSKIVEDTLVAAHWTIASPETVGNFTGVGYYFAQELRKNHDVPIALLNNAWGGSRIEAWMDEQMLGALNTSNIVDERINEAEQKAKNDLAKLKSKYPEISSDEQGLINGNAVWADPKLEDQDWSTIQVPGIWEGQGFEGFDGIAWYRTQFDLSDDEITAGVELHLGQIDDSDLTWLNGHQVGGIENGWNLHRNYKIATDKLQKRNVVAIRVTDTGYGGGIHGQADQVYVKTKNRKISLAKEWQFRPDAYRPGITVLMYHHIPTLLYNQLIHPIVKFPIKGAIWYQGEANAENPDDAMAYHQHLTNMIQGWRKLWGLGDFPFLYVQLANWLPVQEQPQESNWALLRESQTKTLQTTTNTAQAVIIELGEADDIHPRNKKDVGYRLSLGARKLAYGENILYCSPEYKDHEIRDGQFILQIDHVGKGLKVKNKNGNINGFAIAGTNKKYVWAKARLKGNKIIVWSDKIKTPRYLRYGWADNPDNLNVYNSAGLPLTPFRIE